MWAPAPTSLFASSTGEAPTRRARGTSDIGTSALDFVVQGSVSPAVVLLTPIEAWRLQWFGTTANSGAAADTAIAADGMPNLLKYALGLNPLVADQRPGGRRHYHRLPAPDRAQEPEATDVSFHVEVTGDLTPLPGPPTAPPSMSTPRPCSGCMSTRRLPALLRRRLHPAAAFRGRRPGALGRLTSAASGTFAFRLGGCYSSAMKRVLVLGLAALALAGCKSHPLSPYVSPRVTGRVLAADTGQPLADVKITSGRPEAFNRTEPPKGGQRLMASPPCGRTGRPIRLGERACADALSRVGWFSVQLFLRAFRLRTLPDQLLVPQPPHQHLEGRAGAGCRRHSPAAGAQVTRACASGHRSCRGG